MRRASVPRDSFDLYGLQRRLIRREVTALLNDLRPNAVALVDAFEFPDNVLNSAIGRYDGKVYEALYRVREQLKLRVFKCANQWLLMVCSRRRNLR